MQSRNITAPQGRSLSLAMAWAGWLGVVPLAISLTLAGIPARRNELTASPWIAPSMGAILALEIGLALVFFVTALLVTWKRPQEPMALVLAMTLILLGAVETSLTNALILPEHSTSAQLWHWPVLVLRSLEMIFALILLYVFPDGRFVPQWTQPLAVIWIGANVAWLLLPDLPFNTIYGPTWRATPVASLLVGVGWFSTGIIALTLRYLRIDDPIQRRQTWWVAAGLIAAVLGGISYYGLQVIHFGLGISLLGEAYWVGRPALQALGMALLPLCLAVAILRYRLFDLEIIVNRALVHGTLTLFVIATYIGIVTFLSTVFHGEGSLLFSLVATGIIAVLFQPLRHWLQNQVDRLIYGARHEPYKVLTSLGQQLEQTLEPEAMLTTIVTTVATTLKLPYVAIAQQRPDGSPDEILAAYRLAASDEANDNFPARQYFAMIHHGQVLGQLVVAPRSGEQSFRTDELRLLSDLARQAGSALHNLQLTRDLQRSRERIISAREEERRRIRRDLHDGIGPTLASVAQRIGLATALMPHDRERSQQLLGELEDQVRVLVTDIRRLAYTLRPPILDQYGMSEAIRIETERIAATSVNLCFEAPSSLPSLSAAVETTLYRIAVEAVTNVIRHAGATTCTLRISLVVSEQTEHLQQPPHWLHLSIEDDGCGMHANSLVGVGLRSMHERAEEIGGKLTVTSQPGAGTAIHAIVPLLRP